MKFRVVKVLVVMWPVVCFGMEGGRERADSSALLDGTLGRRGTLVDAEEEQSVELTPEVVAAALASKTNPHAHLDNVFIFGRGSSEDGEGALRYERLSVASQGSGSSSYTHIPRPRSARRWPQSGGFDIRGVWQRDQTLDTSDEEKATKTKAKKNTGDRVPDQDDLLFGSNAAGSTDDEGYEFVTGPELNDDVQE